MVGSSHGDVSVRPTAQGGGGSAVPPPPSTSLNPHKEAKHTFLWWPTLLCVIGEAGIKGVEFLRDDRSVGISTERGAAELVCPWPARLLLLVLVATIHDYAYRGEEFCH